MRKREYRTLYQIQSDVELICHNAMSFNQKISKVYKNAQALLKGAKKQFAMERPLLHEAILALHPDGPEAALKDEADAKKATRMAPPPKKPPAKPSKPAMKPAKPAKPSKSALVGSKSLAGIKVSRPLNRIMSKSLCPWISPCLYQLHADYKSTPCVDAAHHLFAP